MLFRRKKKLAEIWTYLFCVDFASIVCPTILLKKNQRILVLFSCLFSTKSRDHHLSFVVAVTCRLVISIHHSSLSSLFVPLLLTSC
mmetsp:Transcript_3350/g.5134  ORF Transcript_3350/g.5134 Transcript_3350/m.5134 type:complete len:86 (-) Transcript_3350:63-320(-)